MSETVKILVAVDFTSVSELALDEAIARARRTPGAELHVLHVLDGRGGDLVAAVNEAARKLRALIAERLAAVRADAGARPIHVHVRLGAPAREILAFADELDADEIVVGTEDRRGLERLRLGSVAERVVHRATCPVLVVRPRLRLDLEPEPPDDYERHVPRAHRYRYSSPFDHEADPAHTLW